MIPEKDFKVSDCAKIAWILKSLKEDRQLVSIDFRESERGLNTTILDIDRDTGKFAIESFSDSICNELALSGEPFALKASLNGVDVTADALSVESVLADSDGPIYNVRLPNEIRYLQRRESFRARVTGLVRVPVDIATVSTDSDEPSIVQLEVNLSNLSADGCRLELAGTQESFSYNVGDQLLLKIHFPDHSAPLQAGAVVCHKRHLARSKLWYVGCQFTRLDQASQSTVNKFVSELQLLERRQEDMFTGK